MGVFNKKIIPLVLVEYVSHYIANSALRASLAN